MVNVILLIGRLTRDAEAGHIPNGRQTPKVRFTLAVDRDYEVDGETPTDFWPVDVVGEYADRLAPHLTKGRLVAVHGAAHLDRREDGGGQSRTYPYVSARQVRFLDRKPESA
jgi:single-strand DNA-binding protein